ncbi:MAG: beta-galactosidase [Candidatus Doudnabacteria bacterium]|nr:beta-galactosidase [Candidatus Doudnabacteria bacterium]
MFFELIKNHKILSGLFVLFVLLFLLYLNSGSHKQIEYGVTFSQVQAMDLGLDWKEVYKQMLGDLGVKKVRLSAYWNKVEPEPGNFNFDDLDYMIAEAEKTDTSIVLSVGRRLPRWPECHDPAWIKNLNQQQLKNALLSFVETVVLRYKNSRAVEIWQVENEPFLASFGECPKPDPGLLDSEIALVKKLDPVRPVLITDSGELSLWISSGKRGDLFGTTLYRYVFSDKLNRYWVNYIPFWVYRVKAGFLRFLNPGKQVAIIELQAEPWTTKGILNTSVEEQFKTMSMQKFEKILDVAETTRLSPQYLWGVEWWYYMKQKQNHPEFWEKAKGLMRD